MIIDIDEYGSVLCDRGNFGALKVLLRSGGTLDAFGAAGDETGHISVTAAELRAMACSAADDPRWILRLDSMIASAPEHGWVDADGRIRVHVERVD